MSGDQYWQTVGQWQAYDERESRDEAAAMRQMEADQAAHDHPKHARLEAACVNKKEPASTQLTTNRNPK